MIDGDPLLAEISAAFKRSRILMLTGPRQCGKTTLTRLDEPMTALRPLIPSSAHRGKAL